MTDDEMCSCDCKACRRDDCLECDHLDTPDQFSALHARDIPTRHDEPTE
jgi:hypothetical protein